MACWGEAKSGGRGFEKEFEVENGLRGKSQRAVQAAEQEQEGGGRKEQGEAGSRHRSWRRREEDEEAGSRREQEPDGGGSRRREGTCSELDRRWPRGDGLPDDGGEYVSTTSSSPPFSPAPAPAAAGSRAVPAVWPEIACE